MFTKVTKHQFINDLSFGIFLSGIGTTYVVTKERR